MQDLNLEVLTLLIALYGAVLSTILGIRAIRRDIRKVLVKCRMALGQTLEGDVLEFIEILAVNVGHRPVEIVAAGLHMSNDFQFLSLASKSGPTPLPQIIRDGESVSVLIDYPDAKKALREQGEKKPNVVFKSAFVRDAEGNQYRSDLPRVLKDDNLARRFL